MSEPKTKPTAASVADFLDAIASAQVRNDCWTLVGMMQAATQAEPQMWGDSIVGFGRYRYHYASGRTGESVLTGFSPRKQNLTIYIVAGFDHYEVLLARLGKHTRGKACLYVKRLADIDLPTLQQLIDASVQHMRQSNLSASV